MSGGAFEYNQYRIQYIIDEIEHTLERQGKKCDFAENAYNVTYSKEVQDEMRNGIRALKIAQVYAQRIDWLISNDDGEETFLRRLRKELSEI